MQVSLKWLSEYVDLRLPPEELAAKLTMAGLAVDRIVRTGGEWGADIRVGQVAAVEAEPSEQPAPERGRAGHGTQVTVDHRARGRLTGHAGRR